MDHAPFSSAPSIELPRGLALNRYQLICPGRHCMTRFAKPASKEERRNVEASLGQAIYQSSNYAYAHSDITVSGGGSVEFECNQDRGLHLFDLRERVAEHASDRGLSAVFRFGGELHITGLSGDIELDGIHVQRRLKLRVVEVGSDDATWLVAKHDFRLLAATCLADKSIWDRAIGEIAEPIINARLPRGEVVSLSEGELILSVGDKKVLADPTSYTFSVRYSYVKRYHSSATVSKLQEVTGALSGAGRRNRYAVKDRFLALINAMDQLGWTMPSSDGRLIIIDPHWTEIRIQAGAK
jgi:hypothetical protein